MEYEFVTDRYQNIRVKCSMEHVACAHWCNDEIKSDIDKLERLFEQVKDLKSTRYKEWTLIGKEYSLNIHDGEVKIYANSIENGFSDQLAEQLKEEGIALYENESFCEMGITDFISFLESYLTFINNNEQSKS